MTRTNMHNVFIQSLSVGVRQWRMAVIVYVFQLCLVLTLGMQVFRVFEASIGHSLEIHKLLSSYDHTVLTDFLKVHGASITPLIGELRWLVLGWLIFSVFINAGLLFCAASPEEASGRAFWKGGAGYFFPFLKISLVFLLLALIWTAIIWLPVAIFLEPSLEYFPSEKYTVWLAICLVLVYLGGLAMLFLWSVISRVLRMKTCASIAGSVIPGWRVFRNSKWKFLGLLAGFCGVQFILILAYWLAEASSGMTSPVLIVVFFVVQQAFVFFRIQLRQMIYAGVSLLTGTGNTSGVASDGLLM